jgi:hypothetical protein
MLKILIKYLSTPGVQASLVQLWISQLFFFLLIEKSDESSDQKKSLTDLSSCLYRSAEFLSSQANDKRSNATRRGAHNANLARTRNKNNPPSM